MEIVGTLRKNDVDEWEIVDGDGRMYMLSSGSICEVQIGGRWIRMRIEFYDGSRPASGALAYVAGAAGYDSSYHAVELCILLCEGLPARVAI
jgi:hypothetical protein